MEVIMQTDGAAGPFSSRLKPMHLPSLNTPYR